jgi:hypothetical protein
LFPKAAHIASFADEDHTSNEREEVLDSKIMMAHIDRNDWSKLLTL